LKDLLDNNEEIQWSEAIMFGCHTALEEERENIL